jgi:hypothetical protein
MECGNPDGKPGKLMLLSSVKLANQYSHFSVSRDQCDMGVEKALMADMEDLAEVSHRQIPSTLTLRCIGSSSLINVELASRSRTYKRLRTQGIC